MSTHRAAGHRRRGLAAGFIAIGMFLAPISPAVAAEDEADIPDPAFRACLSKALDGAPRATRLATDRVAQQSSGDSRAPASFRTSTNAA